MNQLPYSRTSTDSLFIAIIEDILWTPNTTLEILLPKASDKTQTSEQGIRTFH